MRKSDSSDNFVFYFAEGNRRVLLRLSQIPIKVPVMSGKPVVKKFLLYADPSILLFPPYQKYLTIPTANGARNDKR